MLQFTDSALDAALASGQTRTLRPTVRFDWLKTDTFTGTASEINSDHIIQLTCVDDVDSGLPDEVTGRATASSTTLTVRFKGETADGTPFWRLFTPWNVSSPFRNLDLTNAGVRYTVATATSPVATETRRFTGWVTRVDADRSTGTVTVVCRNNQHIQGHMVTLPRWARQTDFNRGLPHLTGWDIPNEDRMENAPLTSIYLFQNVLRQCNAVPGPSIRSNAIWFSSGYGGMIPERASLACQESGAVSNQGISQYVFPQNWGAPNYNRDILSFGELGFPSPFCETTQTSGLSGNIFDNYSDGTATVEVLPTSGQPRYLNGGTWARIPSGDSGAFVNQTIFLDPKPSGAESDRARVELVVGASSTTITVQNTAAGSAFKRMTCNTPTTKDILVYVSWEVDFQVPANNRLWYNDVLQTVVATGTLATYPTLYAPYVNSTVYRTQCRLWTRHAGFLNAEVWLSSTVSSGARVATWSNTTYGRKDFAFINGGLLGARFIASDYRSDSDTYPDSGYVPCVTHIPVRQRVDAWELLKEMCAAFNMTMWIDAYGGLRVMTQGVMGVLERRLTDPRKQLDGDTLQGLSLTSSFDNIRDAISYSAATARANSGTVFQASQWQQFSCPANSTVTYRLSMPPDSISWPTYIYEYNRGGLGGGGMTFDEPSSQYFNQRGFMATQGNGDAGTNVAVWPVFIAMQGVGISQSYVDLDIASTHSQKVYMALATASSPGAGQPSSPMLLLPGTVRFVEQVQVYQEGTGDRLLQIPNSEFHSAPWTMQKTIQALLARVSVPVPRCQDLMVPGDPRREMYDALTLKDPDGGVDMVVAQIIGRSDSWTSSTGYQQTLTVRLITTPGDWLMEIEGFTEAEQTTYFG